MDRFDVKIKTIDNQHGGLEHNFTGVYDLVVVMDGIELTIGRRNNRIEIRNSGIGEEFAIIPVVGNVIELEIKGRPD